MTQDLFRQDTYLPECTATVLADGTQIAVSDTRKAKDAQGMPTADIWHVINTENTLLPPQNMRKQLSKIEQLAELGLYAGAQVTARIDWPRRHRMMRFHTTRHLLCHIVPQLVNGCSITPDAAHPVTVGSMTDAELDTNLALVKSMSVSPPRGSGVVRTIRVGQTELIDLQPCGGMHVANTLEIDSIVVTKIEKKSATTRGVVLGFV